MRAIMYSTDYCTLCEQALDLLLSMPELAGAQLEVIDIAGNAELEARYANRLPVLSLFGNATEVQLSWPFDAHRVRDSISQVE